MENILELQQICKTFPRSDFSLDNLSFSWPYGAILGVVGENGAGKTTTIGCILTNAALSKVQANKLAALGHNGLARSVRPVHTDHDGDTLFALSKGTATCEFAMLQVMAEEAVSRAVTSAVLHREA